MFHVGQKVVCVDASPDLNGEPTPAALNTVYTVDGIDACGPHCCGLILAEVPLHLGRWSHCSMRFRPIVERKTDISVFHKILRKSARKDRIGA